MKESTSVKKVSKRFLSLFICTILLAGFLSPQLTAKANQMLHRRIIGYSEPIPEQPEKRTKSIEKETKRTEHSKTFLEPDGTYTIKYYPRSIHVKDKNGHWVDKDADTGPHSIFSLLHSMVLPITNLSLCLYAAGDSFDQSGTKTADKMSVYNYIVSSTEYKSDCYMRFPDLRDLIPHNGAITATYIVTQYEEENAPSFSIAAYAITSSWNPATVTSINLPTYNTTAAASGTWTLTPGSNRSDRSLDITTLAQAWFDETQSCFGVLLKSPTQAGSVCGVVNADLPVLLVKYQVHGTPSDPAYGGSYYTDNMCPPVLIPGRTVLVDRMGDLQNQIKSWFVAKFDRSEFYPYCFDNLGDWIKLRDEITVPDPNLIPLDPPRPITNTYFSTYSFPPLNDDIYTNNAIGIIDLENYTPQPGITPAVPGTQSYPFLNLTDTSTRHDFVDISPLLNTPISLEKYPNYPLNNANFTFAMLPDDNRISSSNEAILPLPELPSLITKLIRKVGKSGEKRAQFDKSIFAKAFASITTAVSPKDGNLTVTLPATGNEAGGTGCVKAIMQPSYNSAVAKDQDAYLPTPIPPFGIGFTSALDERIAVPGSSADPGDHSLLYYSSSGSTFRFGAIWNQDGTQSANFSSPPSSDWRAFYDGSASIGEQYKIQSKTSDLTYCFSSVDGYLRKVISTQGGEITFSRSQNNPNEVNTIQTNSGYEMNLTYNVNHMVDEIEETGSQTSQYFVYNGNYQLTTLQYSMEREASFAYNTNSLMTGIQINNTTQESFAYQTGEDAYGVSSILDACEHESTLTVNAQSQSSTATDALDHETTFSYYHEGSLKSITDDQDNQKTFYPDSEQNSTDSEEVKSCATGGSGGSQTTEYGFDEFRNVVSITDAVDNTATYEYNSRNKPTMVTDREGQVTEITYTNDGNQPATITYPDGRVVSYDYGNDVFLDSITTSYKTGETATTSITRDTHGYIDTVTDPLEKVTYYSYDFEGKLLSTTDPLGRETEYTYDDASRVTAINVTSGEESKSVTLAYNALNQVTSVTDPASHETDFAYDACGNLTTETDALDNETTFVHDDLGQLTSVTDARSHTTTAAYDALGRITSITDPDSKVTSYQYDAHSRLYRVTDPLSQVTEIAYDSLNRVTSLTDPKDGESTFAYNKEGYLTSMTDPKSHTWNIDYLDGYRVGEITGPLSTSLTYDYYPFGGVKTVTNALDQTITYDYDKDFRLTSVIDIHDRVTNYTYDDIGRLTQIEDSIDRSSYFRYDEFGNTEEVEDTLGNISKFEYDVSNNVTAYITPSNNRYEYTYDALDRVTQIKDPLNHIRQYAYDAVGNTTSFTDPLSHVTHWAYDVRDQLEQITDPLDNDTLFAYDDLGRLTQSTDTLLRETHGLRPKDWTLYLSFR